MKRLFRWLKKIFGRGKSHALSRNIRIMSCSHCGHEFALDSLKRIDFPPISYKFHKFFSEELFDRSNSGMAFYFYLCPVCVLLEPKLYHPELSPDLMIHYIWEDSDGSLYEIYEFAEGNGINSGKKKN